MGHLLRAAARPYFEMLDAWLFTGKFGAWPHPILIPSQPIQARASVLRK
jgi:hypothetical protein